MPAITCTACATPRVDAWPPAPARRLIATTRRPSFATRPLPCAPVRARHAPQDGTYRCTIRTIVAAHRVRDHLTTHAARVARRRVRRARPDRARLAARRAIGPGRAAARPPRPRPGTCRARRSRAHAARRRPAASRPATSVTERRADGPRASSATGCSSTTDARGDGLGFAAPGCRATACSRAGDDDALATSRRRSPRTSTSCSSPRRSHPDRSINVGRIARLAAIAARGRHRRARAC